MSAPDSKPSGSRPSKVTLAASLGGASCAVLIFSLFDTLGRLRGVEMRDQVSEALAEPPFDTMALSTAEVLAGMRVMAFAAGALAAAGLVLAIYVARRHQGARIGFTAVAALLLLTTPVSGMLTFLVGIAALLLWSEPARAWFGGRDPKPAEARRQETLMSAGDRRPGGSSGSSDSSGSSGSSWPYGPQGSDEGSSAAQPPPQPPQPQSSQPPPYSGSYGGSGEPAEGSHEGEQEPGQQPGQQPWQQGEGQQGQQQPWSSQPPYGQSSGQGGGAHVYQGGQPAQQSPYGQPAPYGQGHDQPYGSPYGSPYGAYGQQGGGSGKRPGTVTAAAVLTFLGALGGLLMGLVLMAGLSVDSDTIRDQVRQEPSFEELGWDVDQILSAIWVVAVILTLWSLIALVLAVFVLRRQQWARWLLVASATASALLSLLAILSLVSIIPLILSVVAVFLLFTGGANAWFAGRDRDNEPPSGQQWSTSPGPW